MRYQDATIIIAQKNALQPQDIIFAILCANQTGYAPAYFHAYQPTTSDTQELTRLARQKIEQAPQIKAIISGFQKGITKEEKKERSKENEEVFATRSGLVRELIGALSGTQGKDRAAVLMQIAKLQEGCFEDERPEEERIKVYLPFNSDCRQCVLYQRAKR